jgi:hypothetical protein
MLLNSFLFYFICTLVSNMTGMSIKNKCFKMRLELCVNFQMLVGFFKQAGWEGDSILQSHSKTVWFTKASVEFIDICDA